jgi:hypothetical protein
MRRPRSKQATSPAFNGVQLASLSGSEETMAWWLHQPSALRPRQAVSVSVSEQGDTVAVQKISRAVRHYFVGEVGHDAVASFEPGNGALAPQGFQVSEQAAKQ